MKEQFYKLAQPDGWDFYTGKTINYRDNIGKIVRRVDKGKVRLCSSTVIHASRDPNQCFVGSSIPCSLYQVAGKPYAEDEDKCGFKQLRIIKELNPDEVFKWRYKEACNPVDPFKIKPPEKITKEHIKLLEKWNSIWNLVGNSVWHSVGNSIWNSIWNSVGDSVGNSIWNSVGNSVRDSIWNSVGAYIGYIFNQAVKEWKYTKHKPGEYPFQPAVDLWKLGLVPSFDGKKWKLHGGKKAKILWEGKL